MKKFLLISAASHLAILWVYTTDNIKEDPEWPDPIEFIKAPQRKGFESAGSKLKSPESSPETNERALQGVLRVNTVTSLQSELVQVQARAPKYRSHSGEYGGAELLQDRLDTHPVLHNIWRRVRYHAVYHPRLLLSRTQGRVFVRLLLGKEGGVKKLLCAQGHPELKQWVLMAIYRAFSEGFYKGHKRNLSVELRFNYFISKNALPIEDYEFNDQSLVFNIPGYPGGAAERATRQFKDVSLRETADWSFRALVEPYEDACKLGNQNGCVVSEKIKKAIGL